MKYIGLILIAIIGFFLFSKPKEQKQEASIKLSSLELLDELEREVNNGGFDQYFLNESGAHAHQALAAAKEFKLETAPLLERAIEQFVDGIVPTERLSRHSAMDDINSIAEPVWEELFEEFIKHESVFDKITVLDLMDSEKFWVIIDSSLKGADDYDDQQKKLLEELVKLESIDIQKFDNRFRILRGEANTWDLWGAAFVINGGCSDDCFDYFRGWLIGRGKSAYEKALKDPESLVDVVGADDDNDWEGLSYVAMDAFEQKAGYNMPSGAKENFETKGDAWEEDELEKKFPKLFKKFG